MAKFRIPEAYDIVWREESAERLGAENGVYVPTEIELDSAPLRNDLGYYERMVKALVEIEVEERPISAYLRWSEFETDDFDKLPLSSLWKWEIDSDGNWVQGTKVVRG